MISTIQPNMLGQNDQSFIWAISDIHQHTRVHLECFARLDLPPLKTGILFPAFVTYC